jgi:hypothetical protein
MTGGYKENQREIYGPLFLVAPVEGGVEILFKGALLMMIEKDERLPDGFFDRMVAHIMDLLTGRRSALWDEQALFGADPYTPTAARARAAQQADVDAAAREEIKP